MALTYEEFQDCTFRLADEAGKIAHKYFRQDFDIEMKSDETPVTIADREIEEKCREILEDLRPNDGIMGEEFPEKPSKNGIQWFLDPIDGTRQFITGKPTFGTLIGLFVEETPLAGMIYQPILNERWTGYKGRKTMFNEKNVQTSRCKTLANSRFASTCPSQLMKPFNGMLLKGMETSTSVFQWGGDCYFYGLLASGWLEGVIESGLSTYDFAALIPVVENAGGVITDWSGQPLTKKSEGYVLATANPEIHAQALDLIAQHCGQDAKRA